MNKLHIIEFEKNGLIFYNLLEARTLDSTDTPDMKNWFSCSVLVYESFYNLHVLEHRKLEFIIKKTIMRRLLINVANWLKNQYKNFVL